MDHRRVRGARRRVVGSAASIVPRDAHRGPARRPRRAQSRSGRRPGHRGASAPRSRPLPAAGRGSDREPAVQHQPDGPYRRGGTDQPAGSRPRPPPARAPRATLAPAPTPSPTPAASLAGVTDRRRRPAGDARGRAAPRPTRVLIYRRQRDRPPVHELLVRAGRRPSRCGNLVLGTSRTGRTCASRRYYKQIRQHNRYRYATKGNDAQGWAWALRLLHGGQPYYARAYTVQDRRRSTSIVASIDRTRHAGRRHRPRRDACLGRPRLQARPSTATEPHQEDDPGVLRERSARGRPRIRGPTST